MSGVLTGAVRRHLRVEAVLTDGYAGYRRTAGRSSQMASLHGSLEGRMGGFLGPVREFALNVVAFGVAEPPHSRDARCPRLWRT